jgi:hypothetical protein
LSTLYDLGRTIDGPSILVDIVFAVYIPPQAPAPGQAFFSISSMISSGENLPSVALFRFLYMYAPWLS